MADDIKQILSALEEELIRRESGMSGLPTLPPSPAVTHPVIANPVIERAWQQVKAQFPEDVRRVRWINTLTEPHRGWTGRTPYKDAPLDEIDINPVNSALWPQHEIEATLAHELRHVADGQTPEGRATLFESIARRFSAGDPEKRAHEQARRYLETVASERKRREIKERPTLTNTGLPNRKITR